MALGQKTRGKELKKFGFAVYDSGGAGNQGLRRVVAVHGGIHGKRRQRGALGDRRSVRGKEALKTLEDFAQVLEAHGRPGVKRGIHVVDNDDFAAAPKG